MLSRFLKQNVIQSICYQQQITLQTTQRYSTQAELKTAPTAVWDNAQPFETIPGPSKFSFFRGFLLGGIFYDKSFNDILKILNKSYGQFFRMPGMFGQPDLYVTMNPDDYSVVFRNEGQWPNRRITQTLLYHRAEHYKKSSHVDSVLLTSGEQWGKARSAINPVLMQPKNAKLYLNSMLEVNDSFLQRIRDIRDPVTHEMPDSFDIEVNRLTFESVCVVALNKQLGLLKQGKNTPEVEAVFKSVHQFFDLLYDLEMKPPIWKMIKTPKFYKMMKCLDVITDICIKYIDEAFAKIENDKENKLASEEGKEKSVLEKLLKIDRNLAVAMALDMMLAGIDTTSTTLVGILLCIAKNPEKQNKLLEEIKQILPQKDSKLTMDNMRNLPYLRACIKEGMRIYPIAATTTMREIPQDIVLSNYRIRKNSDILLVANTLMQSEQYVPRAKEFLPERWLRSNDQSLAISNPFIYLPFGFGPRMCAGKRVVDLELEINVARLVRNFNIEFNYSIENAFKTKLLNVPNIPLKFKFEERKD